METSEGGSEGVEGDARGKGLRRLSRKFRLTAASLGLQWKRGRSCHTPQNEDDVTLLRELLAGKDMPPLVPWRGHL